LRDNILSAIEDIGEATATFIDYTKDAVRLWYDMRAAVLLMGSAAAAASGQFDLAKTLFEAHKDALQLEEDMKSTASWGDKFSKAMEKIRADSAAAAKANTELMNNSGGTGGGEEDNGISDDMKKKAESIAKETRLPIEIYNDTIKELNELSDKGLIDTETQARATAKAVEDLGQASGSYAEIQAKQQKADAMFAGTRTPLEQYTEKLKEVNDLLSGGYIDPETATRSANAAWGDLSKSAEGYGDSIKDATGGVEDMGKALENLGSASEVDLGALTGGAQLLGGSSFSTGLADSSSGTFGANDLKAMQFGDAAALKDYQFGDAAALKDYQFSDMDALKEMQFGGSYSSGGGGQDPSGTLGQIRDILASILSQGGQPSTVQFNGGLTSEFST
jgi:hypothetical protein